MQKRLIKIAVGGFSSEVGKTTVLCRLLNSFPGWEAIKLTRGHYRSCGKSAEACCVSHLLADEPVIYSDRRETYVAGKDTGRYWDAGASNVHWVVATDSQVERGIKAALERVEAPGVFIEGNSFLRYVDVDFALMVARAEGGRKIKPTARRALAKASALYLSDDGGDDQTATTGRERFALGSEPSADKALAEGLPVYTRQELPQLVARLHELRASLAA